LAEIKGAIRYNPTNIRIGLGRKFFVNDPDVEVEGEYVFAGSRNKTFNILPVPSVLDCGVSSSSSSSEKVTVSVDSSILEWVEFRREDNVFEIMNADDVKSFLPLSSIFAFSRVDKHKKRARVEGTY